MAPFVEKPARRLLEFGMRVTWAAQSARAAFITPAPWADPRPVRIDRGRTRRLADLVYQGEYDLALEAAQDLAPSEIAARLLRDDDRHRQDAGPCDEFIRLWYATLQSPYLRAEAADQFAGAYTTELAPVPNGEHIGASMRTESLRELILAISAALLGPELRDLEETPEHPLDAASAARWRAAGTILAELDLPTPVSPFAPPEHPN